MKASVHRVATRLQSRIAACWLCSVRIARQCIGVPDYDTYLAHLRAHHPERALPSYTEFFAQRQRARYAGSGRCC